MRIYLFFSMLVLIIACKASNTIDSPAEIAMTSMVNEDKYCPNEGECTVKFHRNSSIVIKEDTIGSFYPVIEEGENIVIEYKLLIKGPEETADGDYSETIHFEVDNVLETLNVKDEKLEQVNLLFGKHCFCRGEAGYYKVKHGNLVFQKSKDKINIDLSFNINEVPHRIVRIKEQVVFSE